MIINDEAQPIQENLGNRLVDIMRTCHEQLFSTYNAKSSVESNAILSAKTSIAGVATTNDTDAISWDHQEPQYIPFNNDMELANVNQRQYMVKAAFQPPPLKDPSQCTPDLQEVLQSHSSASQADLSHSEYISNPRILETDEPHYSHKSSSNSQVRTLSHDGFSLSSDMSQQLAEKNETQDKNDFALNPDWSPTMMNLDMFNEGNIHWDAFYTTEH
jgi:hypothetical protein